MVGRLSILGSAMVVDVEIFQGIDLCADGVPTNAAVVGERMEQELPAGSESCQVLLSTSEVISHVSSSTGASASLLGMFESSYSQQYAKDLNMSEMSISIVYVKSVIQKKIGCTNFFFSEKALSLLSGSGSELADFTDEYGHTFVSGVLYGGVVTVGIVFTASSQQKAQSLHDELKAGGVINKLQLGLDVSKEMSDVCSKFEASYTFISNHAGDFGPGASLSPPGFVEFPAFLKGLRDLELRKAVPIGFDVSDYKAVANAAASGKTPELRKLSLNVKHLFGSSGSWLEKRLSLQAKVKSVEQTSEVYRFYGYKQFADSLMSRDRVINADLAKIKAKIENFSLDPSQSVDAPVDSDFPGLAIASPQVLWRVSDTVGIGNPASGGPWGGGTSSREIVAMLQQKDYVSDIGFVLGGYDGRNVVRGLRYMTKKGFVCRAGDGKDDATQQYSNPCLLWPPGNSILKLRWHASDRITYLGINFRSPTSSSTPTSDYWDLGDSPKDPPQEYTIQQPAILVALSGQAGSDIDRLEFHFVVLIDPLSAKTDGG